MAVAAQPVRRLNVLFICGIPATHRIAPGFVRLTRDRCFAARPAPFSIESGEDGATNDAVGSIRFALVAGKDWGPQPLSRGSPVPIAVVGHRTQE